MKHRRICDYEGSDYRSRFWEESDRTYEDAAERLALRSLLPPSGERLLEIGAGYGRFANEYYGYSEVYLLDYALSMLQDAARRHGKRHVLVCADLYNLPLATAAIDTATQIRVLHHVEDVPNALVEVARVLRPGGSLVLEFANKRHLKARLRRLAGLSTDDLASWQPLEFVELNWNFHPAYVDSCLAAAGLHPRQRRAVSHFRLRPLKRRLPARLLARADHVLGAPLAGLSLAPSQFVRAAKIAGPPHSRALWRCPGCGHEPLSRRADSVPCPRCGRDWPIVDGVYVFRE